MAKRLEVLAGPDQGRSFPLGTDAIMIGRSRATETQLIDPHISRIHCQVLTEGGHHYLIDFESPGGTFVNGKSITRHLLLPGDIIRIGQTRLQYIESPDSEQKPAPVHRPAGPAMWARQLSGQKMGHFKVGPLLGQGKTGYVFHGRDIRRNIDVAIKVLDPVIGHDDHAVQRFVAAMKAVLPLRHPNILRVYGAGKTGTNCWVAMEYLPGENLAAVIGRIETTGLPDWRNVLRVGIYLARGLQYAHSKKMIHRNLTPQNILLGRDLKITKISDLMLASAVERDPTLPINEAGEASDALPFMPPERCDAPDKRVDARADLYSLGATLYCLLSGKPPFSGKTPAETIQRIKLEAPASLRDLHLGAPEEFLNIIQKLLAKREEDRYQSAKELRENLEKLAQANGVSF